jgi:acyl carrier protein
MTPAEAFSDPKRREEFFALAARVFGAERSQIGGATSYGSIPGWDSVNHLRLVMEAERAFGVRYPLERIPSLTTLDDFLV